jgi:hypothetical protein
MTAAAYRARADMSGVVQGAHAAPEEGGGDIQLVRVAREGRRVVQRTFGHRVPWREMIGARYGLDQAGRALAAVERREVTKAVIVPGAA